MTDSPAVQAPIDPKEGPIFESILSIRDKLSLLKEDKSTYIRSHDVLNLYDQVIEQIHLLNVIREEHGKPLEQNRGIVGFYTDFGFGFLKSFQKYPQANNSFCQWITC